MRASFIITIDTEGDNLWAHPRTVTTENARWLPRFQALCEKYHLKPTYLTNWEMANSPVFQEFAADVLVRHTAEIGMHLHAWNSPPLSPLTEDDSRYATFLIDYPEGLIREKVAVLTDRLEQTFGVKMTSHRAGRWIFNHVYARALADHGYQVDCSVTPHVSWKATQGAPSGPGGSDYSRFPEHAYFLDLDDISRAGTSSLLEVPMTIVPNRYPVAVEAARRGLGRHPLGARVMQRLFPSETWMIPNRRNGRDMLSVLSRARQEGRDYVEFTLHSSELMPGGSPVFTTAQAIEALYADLEALFDAAREGFTGETLTEYARRFAMATAQRESPV